MTIENCTSRNLDFWEICSMNGLFVAAIVAFLPIAAFAQAASPQTLDDFATHRVQTAPGVNLVVRDGGGGPALILLHGWP